MIHIAREYCTDPGDWMKIAELNNLKPPYTIYEDNTILVPEKLLRAERLAAKVAAVHGDALLVEEGKQAVPLQSGDFVLPGGLIETGADGFLYLILPDNSYSRIEPNTQVRLTYLFRLEEGSLKSEFYLQSGRVVHSIHRKLKVNETFRTRTPVAITGVRGTEFRLKVEDDVNLVETLRGKVLVQAGDTKIPVSAGQGSLVRRNHPPESAHSLPDPPGVPETEEVYRTLPIMLPVLPPAGAERMRLRVTTDEEGKDSVFERVIPADGNLTFMPPADGTYYAFFTTIDKHGFEGMESGPAVIKVRTIPGAPVVSSPKNDTISFSGTRDVEWLKGEAAVAYRIQVANSPDFRKIVGEKTLTDNFWTFSDLVPGKYYFRAKAIASDGFESLYSDTLAWEVADKPSLGTMEPSAVGDGINLHWSAMKKTGTYNLQIAEDKQFEKLIVSVNGLENPEYSTDMYMKPGKYYVRIRGALADGQQSPWTPPQLLQIEPEPLSIGQFISIGAIAICILL